MHLNGCISSNLSDVFPSLPFQDSVVNNSISASSLNLNAAGSNSSNDTVSRLKFLGLGVSQTGNVFFNEDRSRTNLIINYLPQSYDQNDLQRLFERVGPIRQCKLIRDKNTGASLCYGFVDFVNPQHAALAIQTYHGYETEQKRLRVAYASSGGRRFTPAHRLTSGSNLTNNEVTNENIIGWEIFVIGIPMEWTETDLLRLFSNFGTVMLIRLLPPQMSDSPPVQKSRLSPAFNGGSSDLSSDSVDKSTSSATVIFEEKASAEHSVLRLNGYQAPDWTAPLRLRIIGSVTRETYGLFCIPSRHSPTNARAINGHMSDPLSESDLLGNMLNRRNLNTPNCTLQGNNQNIFLPDCTKNPELSLPASLDVSSSLQFHNTMPPRAIIRNKISESNNGANNRENLSHANPFDFLDYFDGQSNANGTNLLSATDRFNSRDMSLVNAINQRLGDEGTNKIESSLRPLTGSQNLPWSYPQHRSILSTLPESGRSADMMNQSLLPPGPKRLSIKSPLVHSPIMTSLMSQRNCQIKVWLKLENVQPTGSFKIRGVENACRKWAAAGVTHIVCPTNGNAGIAAAFAAHAYGIGCTLIVPESCESVIRKRLSQEAPDSKVVASGSTFLEAHHRAEQLLTEMQTAHNDATIRLLHPYDQAELWEGYETLVDELASEIVQPDAIVLSVGGGGLLAGVIQGLWNKGWSSTHVVAVETEGADCLNRSWKAGQFAVIPRGSSIATALSAPVLAQRTWNLAQCHSMSPITCTDIEAIEATKHFLDDQGMLVEPASGAALSAVYSGYLARLQHEGRIPRPANVVIIVGGGRNVSLHQLIEWENQLSCVAPEQIAASVLPGISSGYVSRMPAHTPCQDNSIKSKVVGHPLEIEDTRAGISCTRSVTAIVNKTAGPDAMERETANDSECTGALNPHDLVNFSKLLATSEAEGEDGANHE